MIIKIKIYKKISQIKSVTISKILKKTKSLFLKKFFLSIIFVLYLYLIGNKNLQTTIENENFSNNKNNFTQTYFYELFNTTIESRRILIFEPYYYHHECTPGYTKYFIDLGFNVDILWLSIATDSLCIFPNIGNVRMFVFDDLKQIKNNTKNLSSIIKKYDFVLLGTNENDGQILNGLDLLNINNSIFMFHDCRRIGKIYKNYINQNRIWTIGGFQNSLLVNPHYFGNIKLKDKNNKTRFFMTSTPKRKYNYLVENLEKIKKENYEFEIIAIGRVEDFNSTQISNNLSKNIIFKYNINYSELYQDIIDSDFIILPLDLKNKNDQGYLEYRISGSLQLSFGFLKPLIINDKFSEFNHLNDKNSLLYNISNLYDIIKKAILLDNVEYKKLQRELQITEKEIFNLSIQNIKKTLKL